MADRFFRATALAGDMHFIDLKDWDPWEPHASMMGEPLDQRAVILGGDRPARRRAP